MGTVFRTISLRRRRKMATHGRHGIAPIYDALTQYGARCDWLKDDKFLRDLEGDSVDTEILDEELRSLQDDEPRTCRGNTVKVLESNPFGIVLCVLVLVDAGVVLAEILLDLHAIRGQYEDASEKLGFVLDFLNTSHPEYLGGYQGRDADTIIGILKRFHPYNKSYEIETDSHGRKRRSSEYNYERMARELMHANYISTSTPSLGDSSEAGDHIGSESRWDYGLSTETPDSDPKHYMTTTLKLLEENIRLRQNIERMYDGIQNRDNAVTADERGRRQTDSSLEYDIDGNNNGIVHRRRGAAAYTDETRSYGAFTTLPPPHVDVLTFDDNADLDYGNWTHYYNESGYGSKHTKSQKLFKIAHILHYCSIAVLGIFVMQLFLKLYGMGLEFFKKKMEIFDGAIILASFALDLVFLEGIGGAQGEQAAALLIMFLLWRILRVINGIMVTAKKRQEFRIKLQKRARRRADKKIEIMEEEKHLKEKEISALKELCASMGAHEDDIAACKPRRRSKGILSRLDTSMGLTSVASLSLSLSMSMSGGVLNMARSNPYLNRQGNSSTPSPRVNRPSLGLGPRVGGSADNLLENHVGHLRGGNMSPAMRSPALPRIIMSSMEKVIEEEEERQSATAAAQGTTNCTNPNVNNNNIDSGEKMPEVNTITTDSLVHEPAITSIDTTVDQSSIADDDLTTPLTTTTCSTPGSPPSVERSMSLPDDDVHSAIDAAVPLLKHDLPSPTKLSKTGLKLQCQSSPHLSRPTPDRTFKPNEQTYRKAKTPSPKQERHILFHDVSLPPPPPPPPQAPKVPPRTRGRSPHKGKKGTKGQTGKHQQSQQRGDSKPGAEKSQRNFVTFENEVATAQTPPRRTKSSETVVLTNGPTAIKGILSTRPNRDDVVVQLRRSLENVTDVHTPPPKRRFQTTKL